MYTRGSIAHAGHFHGFSSGGYAFVVAAPLRLLLGLPMSALQIPGQVRQFVHLRLQPLKDALHPVHPLENVRARLCQRYSRCAGRTWILTLARFKSGRRLHHTATGFVFSEPTPSHSRRRVTLPRIAIEALERHRVRQAEERLALGAIWQGDYDLVFPNSIGGPMDDSHFRRREFAVLLKKAGLAHVRFHDLRHTAATLLFAQRVNARVVSEMLGHAGIAITLGLYGHVTPPNQQAATEAMDDVFEQKG